MSETTVTIEVPSHLYTQLQELADEQHTDVVKLLSKLVTSAGIPRTQYQPSTPALQRILDRAVDLGVPDLSQRHDHYLYGDDKG